MPNDSPQLGELYYLNTRPTMLVEIKLILSADRFVISTPFPKPRFTHFYIRDAITPSYRYPQSDFSDPRQMDAWEENIATFRSPKTPYTFLGRGEDVFQIAAIGNWVEALDRQGGIPSENPLEVLELDSEGVECREWLNDSRVRFGWHRFHLLQLTTREKVNAFVERWLVDQTNNRDAQTILEAQAIIEETFQEQSLLEEQEPNLTQLEPIIDVPSWLRLQEED